MQAVLARSGVRLASRPQRLTAQRRRYTEQRIAARVAQLGFADVRAYLVEWVIEQAWLLSEVAAELAAHRPTVRRLLDRHGTWRVRTPDERAAADKGLVQSVGWQARRAARLAELSSLEVVVHPSGAGPRPSTRDLSGSRLTVVIPDTSYAKTADGANVAYQVIGDGPVDIVYSAGWFSNVDLIWEHPEIEPFLRRLAAGNRLILFDRRGTGLSDPMAELPDLDSILDDLRAVMAAARSDRAVLIGLTIGAAPLAIFAASNPERALGLVMIHAAARTAWAPDYPWGESMEHHREETDRIASGWGTGGFEEWFLRLQGDPRADHAAYVAMTARYLRHSMPRGTAVQHNQPWIELDFRHVLPAVHVPTLVIERRRDLPHGRHLAGLIPGSEYVLLEGEPQLPWVPGGERTAAEIERFIAAIREEEADLDRVLATVLYTDVVGSTGRAAEVGDTRWKEAIDEHNRVVRASLARYRGKEVKTMGDGFLATFDAPARAVRCAQAIVRAVERLGIHIRVGLHTGELNLQGGDISGIAAAIGARIMSIAGPGEVLVSATVKDIVAGSGLSFAERGEHDLKGVPGRWRLYAAVDPG